MALIETSHDVVGYSWACKEDSIAQLIVSSPQSWKGLVGRDLFPGRRDFKKLPALRTTVMPRISRPTFFSSLVMLVPSRCARISCSMNLRARCFCQTIHTTNTRIVSGMVAARKYHHRSETWNCCCPVLSC